MPWVHKWLPSELGAGLNGLLEHTVVVESNLYLLAAAMPNCLFVALHSEPALELHFEVLQLVTLS